MLVSGRSFKSRWWGLHSPAFYAEPMEIYDKFLSCEIDAQEFGCALTTPFHRNRDKETGV